MSESRAEMTQALETLLRAIGPPPGPPGQLQAALRQVDDLTQALGPDTSPQLRHFLQRRSYLKALEYLQQG